MVQDNIRNFNSHLLDKPYLVKISKHILKMEGKKTHPYKCSAGQITIGIGRNLTDNGLSEDEIEYLFEHDMMRVEAEAISEFGDKRWESFSLKVKLVILDMLFNMGLSRFKTFKKMIKALKQFNWREASEELRNSRYFRQNTSRASVNMMLLMREYDSLSEWRDYMRKRK